MRQSIVAMAAWLAVSLLSGCYSYQPIETVAPQPGKRIVLTLTPHGMRWVTLQLGPQVSRVEGDLLEADSAAVRLALRRVEDSRQSATSWNGEQVTIPREEIAGITERRLSVGATAIAGGLALGGVLGIYAAFGTSGSADGVAIPGTGPRQ
jgi:hypothetical protein